MINKINIYEQLTSLPYLSAYRQLIQGAVELDVFSQLEIPVTATELSAQMGWNESNTLNLLHGLYSLGYLERNKDSFCNVPDTSKYLVKGKPAYMGNVLLFFCNNQGMSMGVIKGQVAEAAKAGGFNSIENRSVLLSTGMHDINILRK